MHPQMFKLTCESPPARMARQARTESAERRGSWERLSEGKIKFLKTSHCAQYTALMAFQPLLRQVSDPAQYPCDFG